MLASKQNCLVQRTGARRCVLVRSCAQASATQEKPQFKQITLKVTPLTPENIKPFGQIISTSEDGKLFDHDDAQLVLNQGTPRFYIMRLPARGLRFHRITYHGKVTQCLGGLTPPHPWYVALAAPSGSLERFPRPDDIRVFRVPFGSFLKMEVGTWHAGPLFSQPSAMDFYNLELADTNVTDHNTHDYRRHDGSEFVIQLEKGEREEKWGSKGEGERARGFEPRRPEHDNSDREGRGPGWGPCVWGCSPNGSTVLPGGPPRRVLPLCYWSAKASLDVTGERPGRCGVGMKDVI